MWKCTESEPSGGPNNDVTRQFKALWIIEAYTLVHVLRYRLNDCITTVEE